MRQQSLVLLLCALQAALALTVGLAGESLMDAFSVSMTTLLLTAALLVFILLAASVRLLLPPRPPSGGDVAFVYPLHWGTFFPLGVLAGLLLGLGAVRLLGGDFFSGVIHTYEVVGLALGILLTVGLALRRAPIPGAALALGYGLALPSAILLLDPANTPALTYGGHLGLMAALAALVVVFGRYVRIKIVG
jgi:hypothetical protein